MAGISELIRVETDNALSFGNYQMDSKRKVQDFEVEGDLYKVKTYSAMTKLEKNGRLLYESVPGTTVYNMVVTETEVTFDVEGAEDAMVTVELESEVNYMLHINGAEVEMLKTNLAGKISFSVDFEGGLQSIVLTKS